MVSKLKVKPFHKVNSPLVDPVSTLRPSGVHCERIRRSIWMKMPLVQTYRHRIDRKLDFIGGGVDKFGAY
jgi:hypothetical protein